MLSTRILTLNAPINYGFVYNTSVQKLPPVKMEFIHGYFNLVCPRYTSDKAVSAAYAKNARKWCAKKIQAPIIAMADSCNELPQKSNL